MAPKGMKRTLSKAGANVTKKCKTIAATIRSADDVPAPVRSMLCDSLIRTFGTYKEERHQFQNTASALVGTILKNTQGALEASIKEAKNKKAGVDAEAAKFQATNDAAAAAAEVAAKGLADSKTAVADGKTACKDAKARLHDLEGEVKTGDAEAAAAATKKEKLEALQGYIAQVKEGTTHGAAAGRHVGKGLESSLEAEFVTCVTRTFSKVSSSWGTFDNIVDERLAAQLKKVLADLADEIGKMAAAKESRAASVDAAKAAIVASEESVKGLEEACTAATAAAKEADAAAKGAAAALKTQQQQVHKAADICTHADKAMTDFTEGALAAYTEVEARKAPPPPEPKPVEEAAAPQAPVAAAAVMAPAPAAPARPSILSSPAVLLQSARNLLPSPRASVAPSPRAAQSPRQTQQYTQQYTQQ